MLQKWKKWWCRCGTGMQPCQPLGTAPRGQGSRHLFSSTAQARPRGERLSNLENKSKVYARTLGCRAQIFCDTLVELLWEVNWLECPGKVWRRWKDRMGSIICSGPLLRHTKTESEIVWRVTHMSGFRALHENCLRVAGLPQSMVSQGLQCTWSHKEGWVAS